MDKPLLIYLVNCCTQAHDAVDRAVIDTSWETKSFVSETDFVDCFANCLPASLSLAIQRSCIILSHPRPDIFGAQLFTRLRQLHVYIPFIVLSVEENLAAAVEYMRQGAVSCLAPDCGTEALRKEIIQAAQSPVTPPKDPDTSRRKINLLTPREREVLAHICDGSRNKIIASKLGISVKTVELHRARVITKLEASCVQDLVKVYLGYAT